MPTFIALAPLVVLGLLFGPWMLVAAAVVFAALIWAITSRRQKTSSGHP